MEHVMSVTGPHRYRKQACTVCVYPVLFSTWILKDSNQYNVLMCSSAFPYFKTLLKPFYQKIK